MSATLSGLLIKSLSRGGAMQIKTTHISEFKLVQDMVFDEDIAGIVTFFLKLS